MKPDLTKVRPFLFVEAKEAETPEQCFASISEAFDPRLNDPDWGPLYQVGPKYELDGREYFQVQTAAGSLAFRMLIAARKGEFSRAVAARFDTSDGDIVEIAQSGGSSKRLNASCIDEQHKLKTGE